MTPAQFSRVEAIFLEADALPIGQREAFLAAKCGDDPVVLRKVRGMLDCDARAPERLAQPALGAAFHVGLLDETERLLRGEFERGGRYRILSGLGEGGFGTVYRAEQLQPVRREVAIKVIKPGMDTRRVLARFEAERQTLAMLNHRGVARLFDAGTTTNARPYFVMDLIDGAPITRYCDEHQLTPRDRLGLFVQVCAAIGHAHQKGVIHRDIKPSNVLVTKRDGVAAPVIIDFGIARALNDDEFGITLSSEHGQLLGTPEYMSPEQALGERDIDTRTDIYALGVLLYELLTGTTPLEQLPRNLAGLGELQRLIRDQQPPTPSIRIRSRITKLTGKAHGSIGDTFALIRSLRGDLDWIVMKAIEKDRARRYETVEAFAADVERFLNYQAILARPPSALYRFQKFAQRNRGALAAAAAISVLLVGGVIGTSVGMVRAQREARVARDKTAIAQAVSDFLNNDLLAAAAPEELGNDVSMRRVVEVAAQRLEGKFRDQPLVEAAVRLSLGRTLNRLSDFSEAERHLTRCRDLRRRELGENSLDTLEAKHDLAQNFAHQDRNEEAERLFREAFEGRRRLVGDWHADTLTSGYQLSVVIAEQGRFSESEALMVRTLALCRAHLESSHPLTITVTRGLGVLFIAMNQRESAGHNFEQAYRMALHALGVEHPTTLLAISSLAGFYIDEGRLAEAEPLLLDALRVSERRRGADHPATLNLQRNLALTWLGMNRAGEAEDLLKRTLASAERVLPSSHSVNTGIRLSLADAYENQGCFDSAEPLRVADFELQRDRLGLDHLLTRQARDRLIAHYERSGQIGKLKPLE